VQTNSQCSADRIPTGFDGSGSVLPPSALQTQEAIGGGGDADGALYEPNASTLTRLAAVLHKQSNGRAVV
jgi:hypothetical protein